MTPEEWTAMPTWGQRGRIDAALRLLEQGEISRAKAQQLIADAIFAAHIGRPDDAPWDALQWGEP